MARAWRRARLVLEQEWRAWERARPVLTQKPRGGPGSTRVLLKLRLVSLSAAPSRSRGWRRRSEGGATGGHASQYEITMDPSRGRRQAGIAESSGRLAMEAERLQTSQQREHEAILISLFFLTQRSRNEEGEPSFISALDRTPVLVRGCRARLSPEPHANAGAASARTGTAVVRSATQAPSRRLVLIGSRGLRRLRAYRFRDGSRCAREQCGAQSQGKSARRERRA